jgi:beta-lactamase regulating signal transducer with metallopeptidase domain
MLQLLMQSTWADRIGWVLVHSLWQFALVALLAVVLQGALKRCSASTRYRALLAAMALVVAVPVATCFSPWCVDAPVVVAKVVPVEQPENVSPSHNISPLQRGDGAMATAALPAESPAELAPMPQPEPPRLQLAPSGLASWGSLVRKHVQPWLPQIVLVWLAGVLLAALRPLLSWYTVRRLRTAGVSPVGDTVHKVLGRTAQRLGLARAVAMLQSTVVKTPVVVGYFRPAILLPVCVVTGLSEAQLELILAHELAHIRRHDYLVNLLQTLVETLFFYHPAVWWLSSQIRNERENCCDDVAMATVDSRADYGRALLAIEELRATSTALSVAACGGSLLARIRRIAGCEPAPRIAGGGSVLCVLLVSIVIFAAVTWAVPATTTDAATDAKNTLPSNGAAVWKPGQQLDFRVINAKTKEPLSGVKLRIDFSSGEGHDFWDKESTQTTDAQGRAKIKTPNRRIDEVRIYPSKPGFVPLRVYWGSKPAPLVIPQSVTVPLEPGKVWGGVVRNEQGNPISGATVKVRYWQGVFGGNPHLGPSIVETTTTDKNGRWRVDVMPAEIVNSDGVRIYLSHPDYVSDVLKGAVIPLPVTERPPLGALRSQTAVMVMRKRATIEGRAIDRTGRPIAGVSIYDSEYYWFNSGKPLATTDKEGRFKIPNVKCNKT